MTLIDKQPSIPTDELIERVTSSIEEGAIPVEIYNDLGIFQREMDNIFGSCWVFVAHESEIPNKGDFVQRRIGIDPVIVTRGGGGDINVLSNYCRHRGTQVCQTDAGNSRFFKCPYHGWTYSNNGDLVGTPHVQDAYGERMDPEKFGLFKAPRIESRHGFIFASLAADGPSLDEYLGGAGWMFDLVVGLHPKGLCVAGPPERYQVKADWKTAAENFAGDTYHIDSLHWSVEEIGLAQGFQANTAISVTYEMDNGHAFNGHTWTKVIHPGYVLWGYPPEVTEKFDLSEMDETQMFVLNHEPPATGTIFPNLSFIRIAAAIPPGTPPTILTSFRQWQPVAPGVLEIWNWQFVWDFQTPEEVEAAQQLGQFTFGSAGIFETDDTVAWEGAPRAAKSPWMKREQFAFNFDQSKRSPIDRENDPNWTGPGIKRNTGFGEMNQLHFYRQWANVMRDGIDGQLNPARKEGQ
ncbi:Rieske 2Fe-2S domain-containing protein [Nocardia sp. NPDC050408]|uniref:aromatic ring-hydroxylating oxygenase subunit alpha n=1 Tax=Nocardia sp. NPDC050408 TaxID=3364319 RepID=UPI0037921156